MADLTVRERQEIARAGIDPTTGLAPRQMEANRLLGSDARHVLLFGGARSMKTFLIVRGIVTRALLASRSRHLAARFRFSHARQYLAMQTLPEVMKICYPQVKWNIDKQDWFARFPNGSELWFGGLDEKERTEKILGAEYCTIFLNEVSQLSWAARNMVVTRLAQRARVDSTRAELPLRMWYDCNPPNQAHWAYKLFIKKEDPETGQALPEPDNYASTLLDPRDNPFIHGDAVQELEALPSRQRRRFLEGEWLPASDATLWEAEWFDKRRYDGEVPELQRIVVAVDPSGAADDEDKNNDEIGIVVAGVDREGIGYVLEDATLKAGPATWGKAAASAFERWRADCIIAEQNYGGEMVRYVIRTAGASLPVRMVTASRGKVLRAEPVAGLYEQGKVRHRGMFTKLEDELLGFTTAGYMGARSPNRADAAIIALTDIFPGMTRGPRRPLVYEGMGDYDAFGW